MQKLRYFVACVLLASSLVAVTSSAQASSLTESPATQLMAMFDSYGNAGGHWTGGDNTASVVLPDGRVAWLFADTFLGTVNPDNTRPANSPMVNNTIVIQQGNQLVSTLHGGTAQAPEALVKPTQPGEFFWAADGVVEGSSLKVMYNRLKRTGDGVLSFEQTGVALATFALPQLTLTSVTDLPLGATISWGAGIHTDGAFTYIYGISSGRSLMKFAHLARVPTGGLSGQWQFWTGSTWSNDPNSVGKLISGVGGGAVQKVGDQYVWVSHEENLLFDSQFVAYTSPSPTGPFTGPIQLFTAPETQQEGVFVYNARVHPELASSGKLLVSYDVNSLKPDGSYSDVSRYRPRFVDVDWPRPAPPSGVPAAPASVSAAMVGESAEITWSPVPGATSYRVYQRNVTAGQTHFARLPQPVTGTSLRAGFLYDGNTYEFKVAAINGVGEGPYSGTASVTIHIAPPSAPATVTATADTAGKIAVSWSPVAGAWVYSIVRKDLTAGDTDFTEVSGVEVSANERRFEGLVHNHEYEFAVAARHGGGESPRSGTVRATAFYAVHAAPTNLTATPAGDGTVRLTWTGPAPDLWYSVYQRDVTAGDTSWTKLPLPITTTAMTSGYLTNGHTYEYRVVTLNAGGESPFSNTATATSSVTPAAAPTSLTATPNADGSIGLTWAAPDPALWHQVYWRDVTAGDTSFTAQQYPVTACCSATAGYLQHDHEYEFYVVALNGAGESPRSPLARATSRYPVTSAPTDLRATVGDGQATLTWNAAALNAWYWVYHRDVSESQSWQRFEYPVSVCCSFEAGYLTNGHTYEYKVVAIGTGGAPDSEPSNVLSVRPMGPAPAAPTNLQATPGDGRVMLSWTASTTGGVWYWVHMRNVTQGQAWTRLEWPVSTCCTWESVWLTNGETYEYKLTAVGGPGAPDSTESNVVSARPMGLPPAAPTNLQATPGDGRVMLSWTASTTGGVWYWVHMRNVTQGQAWTRLEWPVSTCCTWESIWLTNGDTYEYKLTAVGGQGAPDSIDSNVASATPMGAPPGAPSNLRATAGDGRATLTWTASSTPGAWYWVYHRDATAGTDWQRFEWPVSVCCSFEATGLANGSTYQYKVVAIGASGSPDSEPSNVASVTPVGVPPAPPTNLQATPGDGKVTLTWTASTTGGAWYWVHMRNVTQGQAWTRLEWPVSTCCTWESIWLANGDTYQYKLTAVGGEGTPDSTESNVVSVTPVGPPPAPPTNLTAVSGNGKVTLTWTASATTGSWYWLYSRNATHGEDWERSQYPISTCCSFEAIWLVNGDTYQYKLTAVGPKGSPDSAYSNTVTAYPVAPTPAPPTDLRATAGNGKVTLTWTASTTPGVWYWLYSRNTSKGQDWRRAQYPISTCCTFESIWLTNGDNYQFKLTAIGSGGAPDSAESNVVSARPFIPPPGAPSNLRATPSDGIVTLQWNASSTPGAWYWIYMRNVSKGQSFEKMKYPVSTCCIFNAAYLTNGDTYEFKMTTAGSFGGPDSGFSNVVSARPMPAPPLGPGYFSVNTGLAWDKLTSWVDFVWSNPGNGDEQILYYRNITTYEPWKTIDLWYNWETFRDTNVWGRYKTGDTYEFKLMVRNMSGHAFSATRTVVFPRTRPEQYNHFTRPDWGGYEDYFAARANKSNWSAYGFNWTENGCSSPVTSKWESVWGTACIRHDFGYRNHTTSGWEHGSRYWIDFAMYMDSLAMCEAEPNLTWEQRWSCEADAGVYHYFLRKYGDPAWRG